MNMYIPLSLAPHNDSRSHITMKSYGGMIAAGEELVAALFLNSGPADNIDVVSAFAPLLSVDGMRSCSTL